MGIDNNHCRIEWTAHAGDTVAHTVWFTGGNNMEQFKKFVAEAYPETEDYLTAWDFVCSMDHRQAFMEIRYDPQFVLECAKAWKEMEDEDE